MPDLENSNGRVSNVVSPGQGLPSLWYKFVVLIETREIVIEAVKEGTEGLLVGKGGQLAGRARKWSGKQECWQQDRRRRMISHSRLLTPSEQSQAVVLP